MTKKDASNERIIPDLLNMKYEYLFKTLGREGEYSLELKCLFLVLILYVPGLITASIGGTLPIYVGEGWRHFVATVFLGVIVWFLIRFLKRIDEKIRHINQIISPPKKENAEWKRWENKIEKYTRSARVRDIASYEWYYLQAIGGAVCLFVFSMFVIDPEVGWVHELYLRSWYVFLGFLAGACLHCIWGGFWVIRTYCKDVVSHQEILPLDPDRTGGLRELGRLALDLDLIVALPSVAFPIYLLRDSEFWGVKNIQLGVEMSILYALVLIFVFFVSISPAHDDMVKAKTSYLLEIHHEYRDMHKEILRKLKKPKLLMDPEEYDRLLDLYKMYDRVESMAVWPLDFRTLVRFAITSLLPLISVGITIQYSV